MNTVRRALQLAGLPETSGPWVRTVECNGLLFISGLRGVDTSTGTPAVTFQQRIGLIFAQLEEILRDKGCSIGSVLASGVYVTDMARIRPPANDSHVRAVEGGDADHP